MVRPTQEPRRAEGKCPPWFWHPCPPLSHTLGFSWAEPLVAPRTGVLLPLPGAPSSTRRNWCPGPATFLVWGNGCFRIHARTPRGRSSLAGRLLAGLSLCAQASPWLTQHSGPRLSVAKRSEKTWRRGCQASPCSTHVGHVGVTSQLVALRVILFCPRMAMCQRDYDR